MKKIFILILCVSTGLLFTSCDAESTDGVSKITEYANIEFEPVVTIALGDTYTPTPSAEAGGVEIPVTINGDVDTNTVGVYYVVFSATNADGFDATATQVVVVHNPSIVGTDVSGKIVDAGNATRTGEITLIKGTTSIFLASDFGYGGTFPVYFQMDGDIISEIPQPYVFGATSVALTYNPITKIFTTLISPDGFGYTFKYQ